MPDDKFCTILEYWLTKSLPNSSNEPVRSFWCDGILPPSFTPGELKKLVDDHHQLTLHAFLGPTGQEKYELTLAFGPNALRRFASGFDLIECLPAGNGNDWFEIDPERKLISITLS